MTQDKYTFKTSTQFIWSEFGIIKNSFYYNSKPSTPSQHITFRYNSQNGLSALYSCQCQLISICFSKFKTLKTEKNIKMIEVKKILTKMSLEGPSSLDPLYLMQAICNSKKHSRFKFFILLSFKRLNFFYQHISRNVKKSVDCLVYVSHKQTMMKQYEKFTP